MSRVQIDSQSWGVVQDIAGNGVVGAAVQLKIAGTVTSATHYSAVTAGTSSTADLLTDANGLVKFSGVRFVEAGSYDMTVLGVTRRVDASPGTTEASVEGTHVFAAAPTGVAATDLASIHAARDAAPVDGTIHLARGTYVSTTLTLNKAGQTFDLSAGATLKLANAQNTTLLSITAARVTVSGGTVDGNVTNQTSYHYLVDSTADDTHLEGIRFTNALAVQVRMRWSTKGARVVRCLFDGNGGINANVLSSRNAVEIHGSQSLVALNTFRDINQGHGVRVGRYTLGVDIEVPADNLVAFNTFLNMLDPLSESPAMKAEVNSIDTTFVHNTVRNATRAFKADDCTHVVFSYNLLTGVIASSGINVIDAQHSTFEGNHLTDCGGGFNVGINQIHRGNVLVNIGVGLETTTVGGFRQDSTENRAIVEGNILKNVCRFPIVLSGAYSQAVNNRLESCIAAASTAQIRTVAVASEVRGNLCVSPASVSGTVIAFQASGDQARVTDNTLDGAADKGVEIFTSTGAYVAGNSVGDATTPITLGSGLVDPQIDKNPGAPAAEIQTLATDANFTLTALSSPQVTIHTGTLTAGRSASLANGYKGASFRLARSGAGAFNIAFAGKNIATGQWAEAVHDGTAWVLTAFGSL